MNRNTFETLLEAIEMASEGRDAETVARFELRRKIVELIKDSPNRNAAMDTIATTIGTVIGEKLIADYDLGRFVEFLAIGVYR